MKNLYLSIAATVALLLSGCGSDNGNGGGGTSSSGAGNQFVAAVRDTLTQPADAEPNPVDGIGNGADDSGEPEAVPQTQSPAQ